MSNLSDHTLYTSFYFSPCLTHGIYSLMSKPVRHHSKSVLLLSSKTLSVYMASLSWLFSYNVSLTIPCQLRQA